MYPQLCSWDNLLLAFRKASKGKRGQPNVAAFEYRLEDNLLHLQRELFEKTYRPGAYESFYIHDPKRRLISAAPCSLFTDYRSLTTAWREKLVTGWDSPAARTVPLLVSKT